MVQRLRNAVTRNPSVVVDRTLGYVGNAATSTSCCPRLSPANTRLPVLTKSYTNSVEALVVCVASVHPPALSTVSIPRLYASAYTTHTHKHTHYDSALVFPPTPRPPGGALSATSQYVTMVSESKVTHAVSPLAAFATGPTTVTMCRPTRRVLHRMTLFSALRYNFVVSTKPRPPPQ